MKDIPDPKHQLFLTPAALCARWQVTPITLRRWRKAGLLKAYHIGRGIRFAVEEVERFEQLSQGPQTH